MKSRKKHKPKNKKVPARKASKLKKLLTPEPGEKDLLPESEITEDEPEVLEENEERERQSTEDEASEEDA